MNEIRNNDELMDELAVERERSSIIMVVGVGGAGGNAVNHMWNLGIDGVDFMACNTDEQALGRSLVEYKVSLGDGLGAGNDPGKGREAAISSLDEVRRIFEANGTKMLFITAGMGGGTGTGASPVIAKMAHEMGILTVAIVTTPDPVEGQIRYAQAFKGVEELRKYVDSLLIISNEQIARIYGDLSLKKAFNKANDILASAAKGIAEIITVKSDLVNVDFADVKRVMTDSGCAHLGVATAEGENRAEEAIEAALNSPLLGYQSISGAKNILVNIAVSNSDELKQSEVTRILKELQAHAAVQDASGYHDANIIWGTSEKKQLGNALELVVVVTGFDDIADTGAERKAPDLQPVAKQISVGPKPLPVPTLPDDPVVLGARKNAYENIEQLLQEPAYQRRHAEWVSVMPAGERRKEVLEQSVDTERRDDSPASLFDEANPNS